MNQVPRIFRRFVPQLLHMFVLPLFFFAFMMIYRPFDVRVFFGGEWTAVHLAISSSIIFLCITLMRLLYYYLPLRLNYSLYTTWCLSEMVFTSFFVGLYIWLLGGKSMEYFEYYLIAFQYLSTSLVFPYVILALAQSLNDYMNLRGQDPDSNQRMRFYDDKHNLKMVLQAGALLYIAAEENYVNIFYLDNGKVRKYVLRCSMKSLDELCQDNGMVRCHRSYYVNPKHVRVLRKDKEGVISAELESDEALRVPVSKRYYNSLSEIL